LLHATCPAGRPVIDQATNPEIQHATDRGEQEDAPPDPPAVQRVGIAQFFTPEDSRTRRRIDRPFEAVRQLKAGESVGQQGFDLVLSGRLRARVDGRVILCAGTGENRPPDCVVSADVDRVWIERPEDKAMMAEWRM
jgi:hypothetical protein